jgi:hypothetical protein
MTTMTGAGPCTSLRYHMRTSNKAFASREMAEREWLLTVK